MTQGLTRWMSRSLLAQMVGVYSAFVLVVLGVGLAVSVLVEQQIRAQVQASDQALAQEIALETRFDLGTAVDSLDKLSQLEASRFGTPSMMVRDFQAFKNARSDIDHVYWIDPVGTLLVAVPADVSLGVEFEPPGVVQRALQTRQTAIEVGAVREPAFAPGVMIAKPVRDARGNVVGLLATSLSLADLSQPLMKVVRAQADQRRQLVMRIIDDRGELVATSAHERYLDTVVDELPGAAAALQGQVVTRQGSGPEGEDWLYSAVPVPDVGWAVVVQRPASDALAVVDSFRAWLLAAALLFGAGVALLWLTLLRRVIRPLQLLSTIHQPARTDGPPVTAGAKMLARRLDEVGGLARSLDRLERDVALQLAELQTLLQTSNAVVSSLDPHAVAETIIREVGRLVDVQAATVLVPDDEGVLRVLASDGRSDHYVRTHHVSRDDPHSPSALALREGRPVQLLASEDDADAERRTFPPKAYAEGFRSMMAIPIISRHAGGVVLLVHRMQPSPFTPDEVNLLLTFANHATLAWEHAVLYERSDERLREVAAENARLYREAAAEKQTLAAIMGSMNDGLVLTAVDGTILYANPGAAAMVGVETATLERSHVSALYAALRAAAVDPAAYEQALGRAAAGTQPAPVVEVARGGQRRAIHLRLFDVRDDAERLIGRGLLLRDVTREREVDEMKTTLLAAVGHELRTPLSVIKGHASTLLADDVVWSPDDQRHSLRLISTEADRLADLVRNLLDLSRVEAGLLPLHLAACPVDELIAGALQRLGEAARKVMVEVAPGLPRVTVDRARIEVVLRNLLANALAYGGEHVRVRATADGDANAVTVAVSDDGPGVEAGDLPHMFERFYRGEHGERRGAGTGLGLAICKAFVEAHGGTIRAQSDVDGMHIMFTLPAGRVEAPREPAALAE